MDKIFYQLILRGVVIDEGWRDDDVEGRRYVGERIKAVQEVTDGDDYSIKVQRYTLADDTDYFPIPQFPLIGEPE